jgi:glycosyltransferase involved in cell wall biosynthesis
MKTPVFTTIIDTFYRPALLKEAVAALQRQTHGNLEIILVNNGATEATVAYLHEAAALDRRIKLVHFEENQYSPDDPLKMIDVCLNAALAVATGDYVWYQGDDDIISDDYAEKMVALFQGNSECTTAAGVTENIDIHGDPMSRSPRNSNFRPRYMPGHLLALDTLRGGRVMYSAPGTIFTIKRDVLMMSGAGHRSIVLAHLYGIVPFGVTGFDETAIYYQRNHEGQINKLMSARGLIGIDEDRALLKDWDIENRWRRFGPDVAKEVVSSLEKNLCRHAANWFLINLGILRFRAALRILGKMWYSRYFWMAALVHPKLLFLILVRSLVLSPISLLFTLWPRLANLSPRLATLRDRVNR